MRHHQEPTLLTSSRQGFRSNGLHGRYNNTNTRGATSRPTAAAAATRRRPSADRQPPRITHNNKRPPRLRFSQLRFRLHSRSQIASMPDKRTMSPGPIDALHNTPMRRVHRAHPAAGRGSRSGAIALWRWDGLREPRGPRVHRASYGWVAVG